MPVQPPASLLQPRVLIIGAGIAGLTAARELQGHAEVIVLESAHHIGGRCRTITHNGEILELGAAFLQGDLTAHPFAAAARAFGLAWRTFDGQRAIHLEGRKLSEAECRAAEEILVQFPSRLAENPVASLDNLARQCTEPAEKLALLMLAGPTETGMDIADLSSHDVADQHETGEFAVITSGWDEFLRAYAAGLDIRLNTPVQNIDYAAAGVRVTTAHEVMTADYVIITASTAALAAGHIAFSPPLPPQQQAALENLPMGLLDKFFLCWHRRPEVSLPLFWSRGDWQLEIWPHDNPNLWVVLYGGALAKNLAAQPDALAVLLDELRQLSPQCTPQNLEWHRQTDWGADRAGGAYSALLAGAAADTRRLAGAPLGGRVFFAGEAYDTEYATTLAAAFRTGQQAAAAILGG